jgi:hypothetical protein
MLVVKILASNKWRTEREYDSKYRGRSLRQALPQSTELLSVASVLRK